MVKELRSESASDVSSSSGSSRSGQSVTDIESDKSFYMTQPGIIFREDGEKILVD